MVASAVVSIFSTALSFAFSMATFTETFRDSRLAIDRAASSDATSYPAARTASALVIPPKRARTKASCFGESSVSLRGVGFGSGPTDLFLIISHPLFAARPTPQCREPSTGNAYCSWIYDSRFLLLSKALPTRRGYWRGGLPGVGQDRQAPGCNNRAGSPIGPPHRVYHQACRERDRSRPARGLP